MIPESGSHVEIKHWMLSKMYGWHCSKGHSHFGWESQRTNQSRPTVIVCEDCMVQFWRTVQYLHRRRT